jgi:hypothetical protein
VQTLAGYYWVLAQNVSTGCTNRMYNCVYITIDPVLPVSVTISPSANPVNAGLPVTFTATPVNEGPGPIYQWKVNGFNVGSNLPSFTYQPVNGDVVTCVLTSDLPCATNNPATSNAIVMEVNGVPVNATVTGGSQPGETKCYNASEVLTIGGNGTAFVMQPGSSTTMIAGVRILYKPGTKAMAGCYMHGYISTQYCGQQAPTIPATVTAVNEVPSMSLERPMFNLYPNPTSGNFTIEQKSGVLYEKVKVEIYTIRGERMMSEELSGQKKHEFWLSDLPNGLYIVKVFADDNLQTFKLVKTR